MAPTKLQSKTSVSTSLEVYSTFIDVPLRPEDWDAFAAKCGAEVYQSHDWSTTWWSHYGEGRDLRILIFRKENRMVALVPLFIEEIGWGSWRVRIAKQISSDYTLGTMVPLIEKDVATEVYAEAHRYLLEMEDCDGVRWGPIAGEDRIESATRAIRSNHGSETLFLHKVPHGIESVLDLPESFEEYLSGLSRNHRTNFRRSINRLRRERDYRTRTIQNHPEAPEAFEEFRSLHTRQWEQVGEPGHFGDWPRAIEFHRALVQSQSELKQLYLIGGFSEGSLVSAQYGYGFGDRFTWLLPARTVEHEWNKYGLGRVGFVNMVETAIEAGFRRIHLGGAYWGYKSDLGGHEEKTESLIVTRKGEKEKRVERLLSTGNWFTIFYYKIWFKRMAPKLPWKRRPLWHSWIRWRL